MACKEYSAVFLSLWINKDKTPVRVKCLAQLNVCPMLNLKGRGVRRSNSSSKFFWLLFQQRSQWKMCSAHELWMFQRSGWPHRSTSSSAFVRAVPGLAGLEISKNPQHIRQVVVWGMKGNTHRAQRALQPRLWLWSDTSSQKQEKLFPSHRASAVPGTLRKGRPSSQEAEGQQRVPGWAGRGCLWARFSNENTESYPKVIFLPWITSNKHLCVRQSNTQPQDESSHTCSQRAPAGPHSLARDAVAAVPRPRELSRASGSLWECKRGVCTS